MSAVLRTAALQEGLLPALMRTYVAADFVVGLDVDKDAFDKFSMRSCIGKGLWGGLLPALHQWAF